MRIRSLSPVLFLAGTIVLAGCGGAGAVPTLSETTATMQPPESADNEYELQRVNNELYMQHVESRLAGMSQAEQLQYLAVQSCATQSATLGVFGIASTEDGDPLLVRLNWLNGRYNDINQPPLAGEPESLATYEDQLCPDDKPKG